MIRRIDVEVLLRRLAQGPSGQTFVLVSIALVVLIGVAALAVDVGDLWTTRRLMQSAADAGAVAGADEIPLGGSSSPSRLPPRMPLHTTALPTALPAQVLRIQ